jgi:septal ring factor EnvC (AmiA/AmiB activator)
MNIDEDTDWWLGSPTPLEMCRQHALMLENEYQEQSLKLRKARQDIQGLIKMHADALNEKANTELMLRKAQTEIAELKSKMSELDGQIGSLLVVKNQRDIILHQNQELLRQIRMGQTTISN